MVNWCDSSSEDLMCFRVQSDLAIKDFGILSWRVFSNSGSGLGSINPHIEPGASCLISSSAGSRSVSADTNTACWQVCFTAMSR